MSYIYLLYIFLLIFTMEIKNENIRSASALSIIKLINNNRFGKAVLVLFAFVHLVAFVKTLLFPFYLTLCYNDLIWCSFVHFFCKSHIFWASCKWKQTKFHRLCTRHEKFSKIKYFKSYPRIEKRKTATK